MKIKVQVKLNAKIEKVEIASDGVYYVSTRHPPIDGKANKRIIDLLADFFNISKSKVQLIKGAKSKLKTFEIET